MAMMKTYNFFSRSRVAHDPPNMLLMKANLIKLQLSFLFHAHYDVIANTLLSYVWAHIRNEKKLSHMINN
jgi:hypothetical protein